MSDDYSSDTSTTGLYVVGGEPFVGRIEVQGDSDWFRVQGLQRYYDYFFSVGAPGGGAFPIDTEINLRTLEGQQFRRLIYFGPRSLHHKHLASNDIFVDLNTFSSSGVNYEFSATTLDVGADSVDDAKLFRLLESSFLAAAIESNSDRDYLRYHLFEGIEYTIELHGNASNASRETTLADPQLTLLKPDGTVVASDSDSGTGNNAQFSYTPTSSGVYVFEVSDASNGTGSYLLESDQFDDHFNGIDAETVIDILADERVDTRFQTNHTGDEDSFEIKFLPGANYQFSNNRGGRLKFYDETGADLESKIFFRNQDSFASFGPSVTETAKRLFVEATDLSIGENFLTAQLVDDHPSFNNNRRAELTDTLKGVIETVGDRDWFNFQAARYGRYRFSVEGDPSLLFSLAMHRSGEEIKNSGPQPILLNSNELEPFAGETTEIILGVRSNARELGSYTLKAELFNADEGEETRSVVDMSKGVGRIRNVVTSEHQSWHRIPMKANTWYEINSPDIEFQIVTSGSDRISSYEEGKRYYFSGPSNSPRFLTTSTSETQESYEIKVTEDAGPPLNSRYWLSPGTASLGFETGVLRDRDIEIYATRPFEYELDSETIQVPEFSYHTMSGNDFFGFPGTETLMFDPAFAGNTDIFIRQNNRGIWTEWASIEAYNRAAALGVGDIAVGLPRSLTFSYAEGLPSYLDGDTRFADFDSLSDSERGVFGEVFEKWAMASNTPFEEIDAGEGNDSANIMIFKAALESDVLAFSLSGGSPAGIDGDIVLNTNSPLWDDLSRGKQGRFEFLRAVGTTLGLSEPEHISRNESVMGFRTGEAVDSLPFPSSPLPADSHPFFAASRLNIHDPRNGSTLYELSGDTPFYETIYDGPLLPFADPRDIDTISAAGSNLDAMIDLRPGGISSVSDGVEQPYTWVLSEFSVVSHGYGGNGNDSLRGNAFENLLVGLEGDDILIGGVGDDLLLGQAGDDYYSYKIGHGNDSISEQGFGGNDTLRIEGLKNFTSISDDLTFQRLGNSLNIRLDLDGRTDRNASVIKLHNVGIDGFEIESLVLIREAEFLNRISLMSVFSQADETWKRFNLTEGSDSYGRLVAAAS